MLVARRVVTAIGLSRQIATYIRVCLTVEYRSYSTGRAATFTIGEQQISRLGERCRRRREEGPFMILTALLKVTERPRMRQGFRVNHG